MTAREVLEYLKSRGSSKNVEGMAHYGITTEKAYGAGATVIRGLAKNIGTDHDLALELWTTGILDARAVAALIGDPGKTTRRLMNKWAKDFDNWAVCDAACGILFDKTPYAAEMALKWTKREEEFVRRAGFVMMAALAVHDKNAPDELFLKFLPIIKRGSVDERNFVKKAVNWALRQIGKRNSKLNSAAIMVAKEIRRIDSPSARWIASDAIRELESTNVRKRLARKSRHARPSGTSNGTR